MFYTTSGKFSQFIANVSLTLACYINLNSLDSVVKKWDNFLQKNVRKIIVSDLHLFYVRIFEILTQKKNHG